MRIRNTQTINDLEWTLSVGIGKCYRSTFGLQLEKALQFKAVAQSAIDPWLVHWPKRQSTEASYEMEFGDLFRIGRVTRALVEMDRVNPLHCSVMIALYGDRGARWGADENLSRDVAIFPLTKSGEQLIRVIRRQFPTSVEIRDDEILAQDIYDQKRAPNDIRRRKHTKMRNESDLLKMMAHRLWNQTIKRLDDERSKLVNA